MTPEAEVAEEYLAFAAYADGDSDTLADWARRVAADEEARGWIASLPAPKRQPNLVAAGRCHWVSNEGKRVLPEVTGTGPAVPAELETFVLGVDGRAVAWTHGHGRTLTWL